MKTYFVSFYKDPTVTAEFRISGSYGLHEARLIAEKEAASLKGYRLQGVN